MIPFKPVVSTKFCSDYDSCSESRVCVCVCVCVHYYELCTVQKTRSMCRDRKTFPGPRETAVQRVMGVGILGNMGGGRLRVFTCVHIYIYIYIYTAMYSHI